MSSINEHFALSFKLSSFLKENQYTLKWDPRKHQDRWKICLTKKEGARTEEALLENLQDGLYQGHRESDQKYMQKKQPQEPIAGSFVASGMMEGKSQSD